MEILILILKLFGGLVLIFALGILIGHILGLDDFQEFGTDHDLNKLV